MRHALRHAPALAAILAMEAALSLAAPAPATGKAKDEKLWPAPVAGHVPVKPGEHPRLLFRKSDLTELRKRAETPEGKAIIKRMRYLLNGSDGETMTTNFNPERGPGLQDGGTPKYVLHPGTYTFSHAAGYGFLYQLTGDKKYAEMGRKCMELAFEGCRDQDRRYAFRYPIGALRAGPAIGWTALGYDLCYDAWDEEFRRKVVKEIIDYKGDDAGSYLFKHLVAGTMPPGSNHYGMQVGGAALALLAIFGDPGTEDAKLDELFEISRKSMIRNMTEGFGDHGWFAEGCGTGSMAAHITFSPALQAWRVTKGLDFVSPRSNGQWLSMKFHLLTIWDNYKPIYPPRGMYAHNTWARGGISGAGYFSEAFGLLNNDQKAALLWIYNSWVRDGDAAAGMPFDTTTVYPHHCILSFVNFPFGMEPRNPAGIIPQAVGDENVFYMFRNQWKDGKDIAVSVQTRDSRGYGRSPTEGKAVVRGLGRDLEWGTMKAEVACFRGAKDGSGAITGNDGTCFAVDFSGASGAEAMFVMAGTNVPPGLVVTAGGVNFSFCFLGSGPAPVPKAEGNKVLVGKQTVSMGELGIDLGVMAEPGESHFREKAMARYKLLRKTVSDLAKAKTLLQAGDKTAARALLSEIVKHPDLPQAPEAQSLMLDNMTIEEAADGPKDGQKDLGI